MTPEDELEPILAARLDVRFGMPIDGDALRSDLAAAAVQTKDLAERYGMMRGRPNDPGLRLADFVGRLAPVVDALEAGDVDTANDVVLDAMRRAMISGVRRRCAGGRDAVPQTVQLRCLLGGQRHDERIDGPGRIGGTVVVQRAGEAASIGAVAQGS